MNDAPPLDRLAETAELRSVLLNSFAGRRLRQGRTRAMAVQRNVSYAIESTRLLYRIEVHCELLGDAENTTVKGDHAADPEPQNADRVVVAELDVEFVCDLPTRRELPTTDDKVLTAFGEDTVYRMAFPYIREMITAMSVRLGLPPITVGILRAGQAWPSVASLPDLD